MAAKTEALVALKQLRYAGAALQPGDLFFATPKDAKLLIAVRKAKRSDPPAYVPPPAPAVASPVIAPQPVVNVPAVEPAPAAAAQDQQTLLPDGDAAGAKPQSATDSSEAVTQEGDVAAASEEAAAAGNETAVETQKADDAGADQAAAPALRKNARRQAAK